MSRLRDAVAALLLLGSLGSGGCRVLVGGLDGGAARAGDPADAASTPPGDAQRDFTLRPRADLRPPGERPLPLDDALGAWGAPFAVGCADGTREGFADADSWRDVAGCSGAFRIPGLFGDKAQNPQCGRQAGNQGANLSGIGCSVADLCAEGWHVCRDAAEVERLSRTDCESAVPPGQTRFFVVLQAASPQGTCYPDDSVANDLHGCGTWGQPENASCHPLDRRMGFADCLASGESWWCGRAADHLNEARLVFKSDGALGGALCCRDARD